MQKLVVRERKTAVDILKIAGMIFCSYRWSRSHTICGSVSFESRWNISDCWSYFFIIQDLIMSMNIFFCDGQIDFDKIFRWK